jgi:hypothetical protein
MVHRPFEHFMFKNRPEKRAGVNIGVNNSRVCKESPENTERLGYNPSRVVSRLAYNLRRVEVFIR